jgi:hypothetical protein
MAQNIRTGERIRMNFRSIQSSFNSDRTYRGYSERVPPDATTAHTTSYPCLFRSVGVGVGGSWIHVHVDRSRRIFSAEVLP